MRPVDIGHAEARELVARGIDKAEGLGVRGALAVVGASGALVVASRMDGGGAGGMARARSKAWISATQQLPSVEHLKRMTTLPAPIAGGFLACSPEAAFPGGGGLVLRAADGTVVGGVSASGATVGPFVLPPGEDARKLVVDGRPTNCEDLLVHYAVDRPYVGQHGDDEARWRAAYGELPDPDDPGLGMAAPPPARDQADRDAAVALADRVIAAAAARGLRVAVAVVDHGGDPVQQDRMDGAPAGGVAVALATGTAAALFGVASAAVPDRWADLVPQPVLGAPGGLPREADGTLIGGLGVGGADPAACAELAAEALA